MFVCVILSSKENGDWGFTQLCKDDKPTVLMLIYTRVKQEKAEKRTRIMEGMDWFLYRNDWL